MMPAQASSTAMRYRLGGVRPLSLVERMIGALDCSPWSAHTAASARCRRGTETATAATASGARRVASLAPSVGQGVVASGTAD